MERISNTSRPCSCTKRLSPRVDAANADLADPLRSDGRTDSADLQQLARPESTEAGHRHAVQTAAGAQFPRVEIGMGVQPQDAQRPAQVAAMARHRRDGADAQGVIAAEQNRQPMLAELPIDRIMHFQVPCGDLRQIAVTVGLDQAGIRRAADIAAVDHVQAALCQRGMNSGDAQRFGAHGSAAIAGADIRRCTDEARGAHCAGRHANLRRRICARSRPSSA